MRVNGSSPSGKTALIFAGGSGTRWSERGYPKQLHQICGEPILHRTVRQFLARGVRPVVIAHDSRLHVDGAEAYDVGEHGPANRWLVEGIILSAPLWSGRMIGVFGDVCFTDAALDTICAEDGFRFFGRDHNSTITGGYPELFAWTWGNEDTATLMRGLDVGLEDALRKDPSGTGYNYMTGAIWQPYRSIEGIDIDAHCKVGALWAEIDDLTDDVDYPAMGDRLAELWERAA